MTDIFLACSIFLSAYFSATLIPMQSEAVLAAALLTNQSLIVLFLTLATCGNVLGSTTNWYLGLKFVSYKDRSWFPFSSQSIDRTIYWYQRYGRWSLWLCWVPIIGDPITLIAGILREPFRSFIIIVTCAKLIRYLVLAYGLHLFID